MTVNEAQNALAEARQAHAQRLERLEGLRERRDSLDAKAKELDATNAAGFKALAAEMAALDLQIVSADGATAAAAYIVGEVADALFRCELDRDREALAALRAPLEVDDQEFERLVRGFCAQAGKLLEAHQERIKAHDHLAESIYEREHPTRDESFDGDWRSPWFAALRALRPDHPNGPRGVLEAMECVVEQRDDEAREAKRPPRPFDLNYLAARRETEELWAAALQRKEEERQAKERRIKQGVVAVEDLEAMELEWAKRKAINAKVARDGIAPEFPGDWTPAVG